MRRSTIVNYWIFLFENASYALALSLISPASVLPLFFERLGASNTVIGLLPALANMGSLMAAATAAPWVEQAKLKKVWLLNVGLAGRVLLIATAPVIARFGSSNPRLVTWIVAAAWAAFNISTGASHIAWLTVLTKCIPPHSRAGLLGVAAATSGVLGVAAAGVTGAILTSVAFPLNFALLFAAAGTIFSVALLPFIWMGEPADEQLPRRQNVRDYLREARSLTRADRSYTRLLRALSWISFPLMAASFYSTHAVRNLSAGPKDVAAFTAVALGTAVIASPALGRVADRRGHRTGLIIACVGLTAAAALAIAARAVPHIYVVLVLANIGVCGINLSQNLVMAEFAPEQRQMLMYISVSYLAIAPARIVAPIIGGVVFDYMGFATMGWLCLATGVVAVATLRLLVAETRRGGVGTRRCGRGGSGGDAAAAQ
jgi:MFS family permease